MGDFQFHGTWDDSLTLIDQILKTGSFKLIVDTGYKNTHVIEIYSSIDIPQELISTTRSAFLWSDEYSMYPIKFDEPSINNERIINQLKSGPLISIHFPDNFEEDGRKFIGRGDIFSTPYFINPYTQNQYSPPEALKRSFGELRKMMQKHMEKRFWKPYRNSTIPKYASQVKPVWIGKNAFELLKSGKYYLKFGNNFWFTYSDLRTAK